MSRVYDKTIKGYVASSSLAQFCMMLLHGIRVLDLMLCGVCVLGGRSYVFTVDGGASTRMQLPREPRITRKSIHHIQSSDFHKIREMKLKKQIARSSYVS